MKIRPLSSCVSAIPVVAQWYYDEWAYMHPEASANTIAQELATQLSAQCLPQAYVALSGSIVVGAVELKIREVKTLPEYEHWLGGVYVDVASRGAGIASELASHVASLARDDYSVENLYLQTEQLDGGLYARLGWKDLRPITSNGRTRLVMVKDLTKGNADYVRKQ